MHRAALQYHQETIQRKKTYLQCRQAGTFLSTGTDCGGGLEEAPGSHPGLEWKLQPKGFLGAERTSGCPPKALDWEGGEAFLSLGSGHHSHLGCFWDRNRTVSQKGASWQFLQDKLSPRVIG